MVLERVEINAVKVINYTIKFSCSVRVWSKKDYLLWMNVLIWKDRKKLFFHGSSDHIIFYKYREIYEVR